MQEFTTQRLALSHYRDLKQQAKAVRLAKALKRPATHASWSKQVQVWIQAITRLKESRLGGIEHP